MTARNFDGERLFTSSEFLTSQQVASYFSRLASKRTLNDHEREKEDSDMDINQREAARMRMLLVVYEAIFLGN